MKVETFFRNICPALGDAEFEEANPGFRYSRAKSFMFFGVGISVVFRRDGHLLTPARRGLFSLRGEAEYCRRHNSDFYSGSCP
jgi:hypothetical protein